MKNYRKSKLLPEKDNILRMFAEGASQADVARHYQCSQTNITRFCKVNGIISKHKQKTALDLTDQVYGYLTVLKCVDKKPDKYKSSNIWLCKCKCGNFTEIPPYQIRKNKSCGCIQKEEKWIRYNSGRWGGYEEISLTYFNQIINHAKTRNLEFNITIEYIWQLFLKQNRKCVLSKLELNFKFGKNNVATASLDRIDSSKGYIEGNVQWVHKDVNIMKWDFNQNYFINICKLVANNKE